MNPVSITALIAAVLCNGLLAGTFFAFACSVVPGLRRVDDATYVTTFRAIDRAVLNGLFMSVFLGAPVLAIIVAVLRPEGTSPPWLVAGAVCSVATFVITAAVNVPLNRDLEAARSDTAADLAEARLGFERRWNTAHLVRTLTSVGAAVSLAIAIVL
ncbi:anthrone oxygenase family protein [Nocardiopsis alba]|uniref:anthrone oxygenase family protein n=1 Tax=Nocardiopsis alba TaxID=53437 RepID=UPI0005AAD4AF|nr:anthrone oxygenase family protein [Nocardiopsis alba]